MCDHADSRKADRSLRSYLCNIGPALALASRAITVKGLSANTSEAISTIAAVATRA